MFGIGDSTSKNADAFRCSRATHLPSFGKSRSLLIPPSSHSHVIVNRAFRTRHCFVLDPIVDCGCAEIAQGCSSC